MSLLDENGLARVWSKMKTWAGNQLPGDFSGATTASAGIHGLVPAPGTTDTNKFLRGDGSWADGNTDEKVTQSPSTTNADYRILLSGSADDTAHTEGANKSSMFKANPNTGAVTFGTRIAGSQVGDYSFAQGDRVTASGIYSHAEGYKNTANHRSQHVFGEYSLADSSTATAFDRGTYVEIVGNGTPSTHSNARTLDWSGNEVLSGKLTVGAAPTNNMDVATKQYVDTAVTAAIAQVLAAQY